MSIYIENSLKKFINDYNDYIKINNLLDTISNQAKKKKIIIKDNKIINNILNPLVKYKINKTSQYNKINDESYILSTENIINSDSILYYSKREINIIRKNIDFNNYMQCNDIINLKKNQIVSNNLINFELLKNKLIKYDFLINFSSYIKNKDIIDNISSYLDKDLKFYKDSVSNLHNILIKYKESNTNSNYILLEQSFLDKLMINYFNFLKCL
jgi:hypothetical protein